MSEHSDRRLLQATFAVLGLFAVMFAGYAWLTSAKVDEAEPEDDPAVAALNEEFSEYLDELDAVANSQGEKRVEFEFSYKTKPGTPERHLEQIYIDSMNKSVELTNLYLKELEQIGFGTLLDAERLSNDAGYVESREILRKAVEVAEKSQARAASQIDVALDRLNYVNLTDAEREFATLMFRREADLAAVANEAMWSLEREAIGEFSSIIDHLEEKPWKPEEGRIAFRYLWDRWAFEEHLKNLEKLQRQQREIQREPLRP